VQFSLQEQGPTRMVRRLTFNDLGSWGGGFEKRAGVGGRASPSVLAAARLRAAPGERAAGFRSFRPLYLCRWGWAVGCGLRSGPQDELGARAGRARLGGAQARCPRRPRGGGGVLHPLSGQAEPAISPTPVLSALGFLEEAGFGTHPGWRGFSVQRNKAGRCGW
jgi:hypothetical protein